MTETPHDDAVNLLLDSVDAEGDVILKFPGQDSSAIDPLPAGWINLMRGQESSGVFIDRYWGPLRGYLPATVELLKRKTSTIAVLATASRPPSLVYFFGLDKTFYANRGFKPAADFASICARHALPDALRIFYGVHDGFVDFFSLDGGLLPISDWRVVGDPGETFLEIYRNGSDAFGFDTSSQPSTVVVLLPDEDDVKQVRDLWSWLDNAYAAALDDIDDAR